MSAKVPNQASQPPISWDIETGGLPEDQLRAMYVEPTFEEFAANCDQRWKPETKAEKFEIAKSEGWAKFLDKAALDPITGTVLAIGYLSIRHEKGEDGQSVARPTILTDLAEESKGGEAGLIQRFWAQYVKCHKTGRKMIGANILGFDLPFLVRRSWILSIDIPQTVRNGRYFDHIFVDLRDVWLCGQQWGQVSSSLDTISRALGVGEKNGNGKDFAKLLVEKPDEAIAYLRNDLELTANCAVKMGVA